MGNREAQNFPFSKVRQGIEKRGKARHENKDNPKKYLMIY